MLVTNRSCDDDDDDDDDDGDTMKRSLSRVSRLLISPIPPLFLSAYTHARTRARTHSFLFCVEFGPLLPSFQTLFTLNTRFTLGPAVFGLV